jgi:excisionase family DNA binding protein
MSSPVNSDPAKPLTVKEVAERLNVSRDTVYRHIPCIRIGSSVRILSAVLESWLANNSATSARRKSRSPFANQKLGLRSGPKANTRRRGTIE